MICLDGRVRHLELLGPGRVPGSLRARGGVLRTAESRVRAAHSETLGRYGRQPRAMYYCSVIK